MSFGASQGGTCTGVSHTVKTMIKRNERGPNYSRMCPILGIWDQQAFFKARGGRLAPAHTSPILHKFTRPMLLFIHQVLVCVHIFAAWLVWLWVVCVCGWERSCLGVKQAGKQSVFSPEKKTVQKNTISKAPARRVKINGSVMQNLVLFDRKNKAYKPREYASPHRQKMANIAAHFQG